MAVSVAILFLSCFGFVFSATELLQNGDFSSSNFNGNWVCSGCHLAINHDAQHGNNSGKVTQRTHDWSGLGQSVSVQPGQRYVFRGNVKLLNTVSGHKYHEIKIVLQTHDQHGHTNYVFVSDMKYVQQAYGWTEVGFDYTVPAGVNRLEMRIQSPTPQVNFLVDHASFRQLAADSQWKSEANSRIEQLRKADVHINVHTSSGTSTNGLTIELQQTKSEFAFGSAVSATKLVDPAYKAYQDFFYDNFEWAVIENDLKWRLMEWTRGHPNFDRPMAAIRAMQAKGIKIRGHNMFWAVDGHSPKFLDGMSHSQILQEMHKHVNDMISHTRGTWIHGEEPDVKLFLNDYSVINNGIYTTAYKVQAKRFKDAGVPIYGVGVQGHFGSSNLDMTTIKYRLDKIAAAGLPIWITELTVDDSNENNKADALEDVLTLMFSHPSIEGVLLWGFWDGAVYSQSIALASGHNVTPNAAGSRYQELFKQRWRTHQTMPLSNKTVRGFKGQYTMNVKHNGQVIETKQFTLSDAKTLTVNVQGGGHPSTHTTIH